MRALIKLFIILAATEPYLAHSQVFISEYIEGSSNNKAIEIYNAGFAPANLNSLLLQRYNNGATTPSDAYALSASGLTTLAPGDVFVVANPSADPAILAQADDVSTVTFYNGDDALVLFQNGAIIDVIGMVGVDPGTNWPVGAGATSEFTLVRNDVVCTGDPDWAVVMDQWTVFPQDTFTDLGMHTYNCVRPPPKVFISEYLEGTLNNKAIEVFNAGGSPASLSTLVIERYNNGAVTPSDSYTLSESGLTSLIPGEVFVVANASADAGILAQADATDTIAFFTGDDALVLREDGQIVDVVGEVGVDPGTGWPVGTGSTFNNTLIRKPEINQGNPIWSTGMLEWNVFPLDYIGDLGQHDNRPPQVFLNGFE